MNDTFSFGQISVKLTVLSNSIFLFFCRNPISKCKQNKLKFSTAISDYDCGVSNTRHSRFSTAFVAYKTHNKFHRIEKKKKLTFFKIRTRFRMSWKKIIRGFKYLNCRATCLLVFVILLIRQCCTLKSIFRIILYGKNNSWRHTNKGIASKLCTYITFVRCQSFLP